MKPIKFEIRIRAGELSLYVHPKFKENGYETAKYTAEYNSFRKRKHLHQTAEQAIQEAIGFLEKIKLELAKEKA
jgi:hypothetical protein